MSEGFDSYEARIKLEPHAEIRKNISFGGTRFWSRIIGISIQKC
jgi:hypothetical protein